MILSSSLAIKITIKNRVIPLYQSELWNIYNYILKLNFALFISFCKRRLIWSPFCYDFKSWTFWSSGFTLIQYLLYYLHFHSFLKIIFSDHIFKITRLTIRTLWMMWICTNYINLLYCTTYRRWHSILWITNSGDHPIPTALISIKLRIWEWLFLPTVSNLY